MSNIENIAAVALRITGRALSSVAERDARADGGLREVLCSPRSVIIRRKVSSIPMQLDMDARSYRGVSLAILTAPSGQPFYRIALTHNDASLSLVLFEAHDDSDIIAVWNAWARYFSLPKLLERQSGAYETAMRFVGVTMMGPRPLWRRSGGTLAKRKPRHLTRRRNAHAILQPVAPVLMQSVAEY